ncbi:MAG: cupredoxin domain-containing protein [Gaiellaceae bacterium]
MLALAPAGTPARDVNISRVTVKMTEYRFALSVKKVPTGTVIFTVVNSGELPHIFEIQRLKKTTPLIQPGRRYVMRVTFAKPGKYYYLCPVGAHVQYGMFGTLPVVAAA